MLEELNTKYYLPKNIAQPWVENDELLLLLDGLDEFPLLHRADCVRAVNKFRQEHMVPLAVCSRVADYDALTTRLKLRGAVCLQPLTSQQVDAYLAGTGLELLAMHRTLQSDSTLRDLAQSPLFLSLMLVAYQGLTVEKLQPLNTIEAHRKHLFEIYVGHQLAADLMCEWLVEEQLIPLQ